MIVANVAWNKYNGAGYILEERVGLRYNEGV